MGTKAPKKKESRERVASAAQKIQEPSTTIAPILEKDEKGRKGNKVPMPVWPEWTDQDIAAEKWDSGHRGRVEQKGKSPNASMHSFEEPEGRIELPSSLKEKVFSWRRPQDLLTDGKTPTVVDVDTLKCKEIDLLSSSQAVADSELMRWIISGVSALWKVQNQTDHDSHQNNCSLKPKQSRDQRDTKDSKMDKGKKESEIFTDELSSWKPWFHIWPKESNRFNAAPTYNAGGKYCVKIFWMGTWRKITVDDLMPCDEKGNILLPISKREHELWPMLLSKALIKVASLDYSGGSTFSEMGDCNIIHCLTGWLPEPIPLKYGHTEEIWNLLLEILPHWKLPPPAAQNAESKLKLTDKESKLSTDEEVKKEETPRPDAKESKDAKDTKGKKDEGKETGGGGKEKTEKVKGDNKKSQDKADRDGKSKDKGAMASTTQARVNTEPEFVLFASYSPPPTMPLRVSTLREMADASEKLRQSGLSHNHPHPVHLTMVRNCPLVAPPVPIPIPRWKLIRQKKKQQIVEPSHLTEKPKPPKFVELSSPFVNYCVSPIPVNRVPTPKWKKFRPETPMDSLSEEDKLQEENEEIIKIETEKDENENVTETTIEIPKINEELTNSFTKSSLGSEAGDKEKPSPPTKSPVFKVNSTMKRDRLNSGRGSMNEGDLMEKKSSRKFSLSPRSDHGSAKGRRVSKMERLESKVSVLEKPEKEAKEPREMKLKAREMSKEHIEVHPEIEINKPEEEAQPDQNDKEAEKAEDDGKEENKTEKNANLWMEYDDFCQCFGSLWIFHKSQTYSYYKGHNELKGAETKTDKSRRSVLNPATSNAAPTPSGRYTSVGVSPSSYGSHQPLTDSSMPFMFVDSLSKIEILVSFASFSRWFEPLTQGFPPLKETEKQGTEVEEKSTKENLPTVPPAGTLIAEPYSWKSLVTGQPILRIKTTGIKGAVLTLPAGRHVLRFMIQAPIGYHVDICSQTPFIFGEEDVVMQNLTKESLRFSQHATKSLQSIMDIMNSFNDPILREQRELQLGSENEPRGTLSTHFEALFQAISQAIAEKKLGSYMALEVLKLEASIRLKNRLLAAQTSKKIAPMPSDATNNTTITTTKTTTTTTSGGVSLDDDSISQVRLDVSDRELAATKIEAFFRGYLTRTLMKSRTPGTAENKQTIEDFKKIMEAIVVNTEQFALQVYRNMFREHPDLLKLFPFYQDEWTKIAYADYNGSYPEQPVNSWFIIFRETFYVEEPVLVVPKLYVNIPSCVLRVVDNDTGEESPRVFVRVAPKVLQKNKNGYTFVAEARSLSSSVPAGKFRMRLIGANDPLPKPYKEGFMNANFTTKEIRDYYIPNRNNLIFRYTVRVTSDHQVSIQLGTSKTDVYMKLDILDNEVVVASAEGKGHTAMPAFTFLRDHSDDDEEKSHKSSRQGSGRSSVKGGRGKKETNAKRAISPFEKAAKKVTKGNQATNQTALSDTVDKLTSQGKLKAAESTETLDQSTEEVDTVQTHKYIIQATVLRDSWPLSRSQWEFVAILKNLEKTEGEAVETSTKTEKHSAGPKGKKGGKESKEGRSSKPHQASVGSRPGSQQFDSSKPNWVLRVVSDANSNEIEIKKDTERQDEIKAMKAAWEAAEPGRAAKAQQARLKFLNENTIKIEKENKDPNQEGDEVSKSDVTGGTQESVQVPSSPGPQFDFEQSELTLSPPAKDQETILKPIDITPYIRSTGKSILLDDAEEEKLQLKMEEKIRAYRAFRERVLEDREADRIARNLEKEKQLQEYEDMQAKLDESRQQIHAKREAYRQKFLEKPPPEAEAEAKKRKTPSPNRGRKSPRSKSPKTTGKSKSPPKAKKR